MKGIGRRFGIVMIKVYRVVFAWLPSSCRYEPSCSHYALQALAEHGAVHGSWLAILRLCRCQPFSEPGFDPVPPPRR